METDETFATFDWGQKIFTTGVSRIPEKYFGKKGMSVFIGSFVWKAGSTLSGIYATATTTTSSCTFSTESYVLALTNAPQTEMDTLSAGEIILKTVSS